MIVLLLLIAYFGVESPREGQDFMGSKYNRLPDKEYSHLKKRKKLSDGKYHYFDDIG